MRGKAKTPFCEECWSIKELKKNEEICGICLSEPAIKPILLPMCGHIFCYECNFKWACYCASRIIGGINLKCPTCRETIFMKIEE